MTDEKLSPPADIVGGSRSPRLVPAGQVGATDALKTRRILVTGASGFIGSHLRRRLCDAGLEVHALSRTQQAGDRNGARWWQGDLAEVTTVRTLMKAVRPDIVFHLASEVLGARGREHVLPTFRSNLMTTVNLLTIAVETGSPRVIVSSSLEEPDCRGAEPVPCSPYAAAKWAASAYARMFHVLYGLPTVILRLFMVYGPAQQDRKKLIPYVIESVLRGQSPQLSSGQREVDWIYVDDVVEGLLAAASADGVEGDTIDLGSGELVTVRSVVEQLIKLINPKVQPAFGAVAERPLEQVRVADVQASSAKLAWRPLISLRDGLRRTIDWHREQARE